MKKMFAEDLLPEISGEENVEDGPQGLQGASAWKRSEKFLFQLGCLTADGERAQSMEAMVGMALPISDCYTITGFQEGDELLDCACLVEVNSCFLLSLTAETFGTVLGVPFKGRPVAHLYSTLSQDKLKEVLELMCPSKSGRTRRDLSQGVDVEDFEDTDFKRYLKKHKNKLLLQASRRDMSTREAYYLRQQFVNPGAQYNWAAYQLERVMHLLKGEQIKVTLNRRSRATGPYVRDIFKTFVEIAAPLVSRIDKGRKAMPRARAPGSNCAEELARKPGRMTRASRKSPRVTQPPIMNPKVTSLRTSPRTRACKEARSPAAAHANGESLESEEPEKCRGDGEEPHGVVDHEEEEEGHRRYNGSRKRCKRHVCSIHDLESIQLKEARDEVKVVAVEAFKMAVDYLSDKNHVILQYQHREERHRQSIKALNRDRTELERELENLKFRSRSSKST